MTLESELETIRTNIVTNLTSKGVTASNTESLNDLVGKVNTVKTPITSSLVLKETYQNDISGVVDCLRDKFRINLSKQGVETLSTDGLTTLSNSISLIKFDTVLTLTSDKTSASTGETVTLTAKLTDINGTPISGATIIFMEENSTLYSGITDLTGKINYSYSSNIIKEHTIQSNYLGSNNYFTSNNSLTLIIKNNILFFDDCSSNKLSTDYGNLIDVLDNNSTVNVSYGNSYYIMKATTTGGFKVLPIPVLNSEDNFEFSADIMCKFTCSRCYGGLAIMQSKTNTATTFSIGILNSGCIEEYITDWGYITGGFSPSYTSNYQDKWVNLKLNVKGYTVVATTTASDGTLLSSKTITLNSSFSNKIYGLQIYSDNGLSTIYFKNVKALKS